MSDPRIVYTDPPWAIGPDGRVDPALATIEREVFAEGFELRFVPAAGGRYVREGPEFLAALRGADALAIYRCRITPEIVAAAGEGLKVVARQGVGFDNLNVELLNAEGIVGFNVPDYCVDEVAAHTLALVLALERRLIPQHTTLAGGRFDIYAGGVPRRLQRLTAGIIGFGRIGRAVATRLRLFYGRVISCDPYVAGDLMEAYAVAKVELDALLASSDVVLLHCLLNEETAGLMDASAFAQMRASAFLVNTARGGLVDSRSLCEALQEGRIAGAGIDVFVPEDPHQDPWYAQVVSRSDVVVTSHRAYLSGESEASQRRRTAEGIRQVLTTGRPPVTGLQTRRPEP